MQQIFVELYNYKNAWRQEDLERRRTFVSQLIDAIQSFPEDEIEVLGYGFNDQETDRRAPYDFFCAYRVASAAAQRAFERQIDASGWYRYFDQVNVSGAAMTPSGILRANVDLAGPSPQGEAIGSAMPYEKRYVTALGRRMAYVEAGEGPAIVFLHGDIMSSYLWRNVIPHVESLGRCIAVDLIGAGDSDKLPSSGPGSYRFDEHSRYLDALLDELGLGENIIFVGHDWGSNLAIDWAMRHDGLVNGIAFSEALLPPFEWTDWPDFARSLFHFIRSDDGASAILDQNMFLRSSARGANLRMLSARERAEIERPYAEPGEARRPTLSWPREVPFEEDRTATRERIEAHAAWMAESPTPKLYLRGVPGALNFGQREAAIRRFPTLTEVSVKGLHWPPEDDPHGIGRALRPWIKQIRG